MQHRLLALDYDGTLATDGRVEPDVVDALRRLARSGRRLLLVTGRQLDDLRQVFAQLDLFARIVAENGPVLYQPVTAEEELLAPPPPADFVQRLRALGVQPLSVGRVVVATRTPNDRMVLETIRAMRLPLQVIFNKGAVMVLPEGMDKVVGLAAALERMGERFESVVGAGDAENDLPFLARCGRAVAVANALPQVQAQADWVTRGERGRGIIELVDRLLATDLTDVPRRPR